jgi:hypothetical protein
VAQLLGKAPQGLSPVRDTLRKRALYFFPHHGVIAFTVPLFDQYMKQRMPTVRGPYLQRSVDGVHPAVDVQHFARGHGQKIAEERDAGLGHNPGVVHVPAQRSRIGPGVLKG